MNYNQYRHLVRDNTNNYLTTQEGRIDEMSTQICLDNSGGEDFTLDTGDIPGVNPQLVNKLLSNELNQLSLNRREQVSEEIHGVKHGGGVFLQFANSTNNQLTRQESEEITLKQFQEELDRCYLSETNQALMNLFVGNLDESTDRNYKYPAYRYARENGSELINDRDFRLTFFGRGEEGNCPKKGAKRMLSYLEFIRQIYDTDDVLFRPICLMDLNEVFGSKEFMYEVAPLQILPVRDPSGRRVFVHLRDFGPSSCSVLVRQQVGMYFAQSMVEDRDGIIFVFFLHHIHHNVYRTQEYRDLNRLIEMIPTKFSAFHLCCPEGRLYEIAKATITLLIGKENRQRLRLHTGSYQECKYALRSFGIPVDRLPADLESKGKKSKRKQFDIKYHKKWLCMREAKETAMFAAIGRDNCGRMIKDNKYGITGSFDGVMAAVREIRSKFVECPRHEDCLFGKGRPAMYRPGNIAMRRLIEDKIDRFEAIGTLQKSLVVWEVVNEIKRGMGRFLREDTDHAGVLMITDDETAFKKISIAFRDMKKRRLRKEGQRNLGVNLKHRSSQLEWEKKYLPNSAVRGRKRPATSVTQSPATLSHESSPFSTNFGVNMSMDMDM